MKIHFFLKKGLSFRNAIIIFLILYFGIFTAYPIAKAFMGSFHDWNPLVDQYDYIGLENFKTVLQDKLLWGSMGNTLFYSIVSCVLRIIVGLTFALFLTSKLIKFKSAHRGIFYMPTVTPMVAVSFVWVWMFNPQFGLINKIFGLDIAWLNNTNYAMAAIIIMTVWKDFGYATIIFLAGLLAIPEESYEAAAIDGAGAVQKFMKITWPLLRPITFFVMVTSLIDYLQSYVQILIMTEGGPGTSTYVISYLIFDEAFIKYNFGAASAMSIILFVMIALLTAIMFKMPKREGY